MVNVVSRSLTKNLLCHAVFWGSRVVKGPPKTLSNPCEDVFVSVVEPSTSRDGLEKALAGVSSSATSIPCFHCENCAAGWCDS